MKRAWADKTLVKMECPQEKVLNDIGKSPYVYCSSRLWAIIYKYVYDYTTATKIKYDDGKIVEWLDFLKGSEQGNITVL